MAIDLSSGSANISDKVLPEDKTRRRILKRCKELGCYQDMVEMFNRFDTLMRNCKNESERADIAKLGVMECYKILEKGGKLFVNGELLYQDPDDKSNIII